MSVATDNAWPNFAGTVILKYLKCNNFSSHFTRQCLSENAHDGKTSQIIKFYHHRKKKHSSFQHLDLMVPNQLTCMLLILLRKAPL